MNKFTLLILLFCVTFANAQSSWKKIDSENYKAKSELEIRKSIPNKYDLYALDIDSFTSDIEKNAFINIPIDGKTSRFSIEETPIFTNPLASKYGYIKSFTLKGIDDKTATGKISYDNTGVHVTIFSGKHSTLYIDPYTKDKTTYMSYHKNSLGSDDEYICLLEEGLDDHAKETINTTVAQRSGNDGMCKWCISKRFIYCNEYCSEC